MSILHAVGRVLVGSALIADGAGVLKSPEAHEKAAAPWMTKVAERTQIPDRPDIAVKGAAGKLIADGVLVLGMAPRLGGLCAALILAPVTALGYQFWTVKDKDDRAAVRKGFLAHLALLGGAVLVAGGGPKKKVTPKPKDAKKKTTKGSQPK
jgi:uncharacterized membrane protein YphA (DoxX/SURF4 family)